MSSIEALPSRAAPLEVQRLSERTYVIAEAGGGSNAGIFLGEKGPILIDALLSPASGEALRRTAAELSSLPPCALLYTHHHGDHTFGAQAFACPVIAHDAAAEALRGAGPEPDPSTLLGLFYGGHYGRAIENGRPDAAPLKERFDRLDLTGLKLRIPTVTFSERLTLHDPAGTVEAVHLGRAHSAGDAAVFLPEEEVLFAGDVLFSGRMPFLAEPLSAELFRAFDRIESLGPAQVVPGHGPPGGVEMIRAMRKYFSDLREAVELLRSRGKSLEEVKAEISLPKYSAWSRYETALPLNAEMAYLGIEDGLIQGKGKR